TGLWTWTSPALVAEVQGWLDGSVSNFGWLIKSPEGPNDAKRFGSRERALASEQPHLVLTFVPPSAAVVLTGPGCSGASGTPLSLSATGLPVLGNPNFAVVLHGVP